MNEVADYVARVRSALADLPAAARDQLLEDLPEHLAEVAAEGEGSLTERLGPPEAYAAELRAAAGAPLGVGGRLAVDQRLRAVAGQVRARLQVIDSRSGPIIGYERGSDFLRLLRPAWWVLRGYLVALALAFLVAEEPIGLLPRVDVGDSTVAGVVVVVAFVIGSIWLGDRGRRLPRLPRYALGSGTALLVVIALVSLFDTDDYAQRDPYAVASSSYSNVESVYVFDEQGRPLTGARVFDQYGNVIQPGYWFCPEPAGGMSAELHPTCAHPLPLGWTPAFAVPLESVAPEPSPSPTPTSTPTPTPTPTTSAAPQPGTPSPSPSATR